MPELFNPLAHAFLIHNGRVDEGIDYTMAGGYLSAIADGTVQLSTASPSGWPGEYLSYLVTQPGPLQGAIFYYAEGINRLLAGGKSFRGGEGLCACVPGGSIEIGLGSHNPPDSWTRANGGYYDQANSTRAGIWMNELMRTLHGPTGIVQGHAIGPEPPWNVAGLSSPIGGTLTVDQLITRYNPSTIIRHDFFQLGQHGRRAYANAAAIRRLVQGTRSCNRKGAVSIYEHH